MIYFNIKKKSFNNFFLSIKQMKKKDSKNNMHVYIFYTIFNTDSSKKLNYTKNISSYNYYILELKK